MDQLIIVRAKAPSWHWECKNISDKPRKQPPAFRLHLETRYLLPACPKFQPSPKAQAFAVRSPKKGQEVTEAHQLILYNELSCELKIVQSSSYIRRKNVIRLQIIEKLSPRQLSLSPWELLQEHRQLIALNLLKLIVYQSTNEVQPGWLHQFSYTKKSLS